MDVKEMGWEGVDWINLAQGRDLRWTVVNFAMKLHVV
jgi:hypothetical protein